ncbi:MAG TPA: lipoyl domain-containing protein [Streptosporangiaceae bacterium]|nr:lipoyl domain-containing protein [Streptosporangiaceae bacterium]
MPELIRMPRLSDMMDEGTVSRWLKSEGESIQKGEPLCEIEMDKATMIYESQLTGRITRYMCNEGDNVEVGQPIAEIAIDE